MPQTPQRKTIQPNTQLSWGPVTAVYHGRTESVVIGPEFGAGGAWTVETYVADLPAPTYRQSGFSAQGAKDKFTLLVNQYLSAWLCEEAGELVTEES